MRTEHTRAQMITETEAAALLGVSVPTMRRWRHEGHAAPGAHRYPNGTIRYVRSDVLAWRARARLT